MSCGHRYKNKIGNGLTIKEDYKKFVREWTFNHYADWFSLIAMSRFKYNNLPESMNERFLEETLFFRGQAGIVDLTGLVSYGLVPANEGIVNTYITPSGFIDRYYDYTEYNIYFPNGETFIIPSDNCVFVRNNYFRKPTIEIVEYYAQKIANLELVIDQNIDAQRTPYLLKKNPQTSLSIDNIFNDVRDFKPAVATDKDYDISESIGILKLDAPYYADKMYTMKINYVNEFLTVLGINNVNITKAERVQNTEVESNNEVIGLSAESDIETRRQAVEVANKKWGTEITVELNDINIRRQILDGMLVGSQKILEPEIEETVYTGGEE